MTRMINNTNTTDFVGELIEGRWQLNGFIQREDGGWNVLIQDLTAGDNQAALLAWFAEGKDAVLDWLAETYPGTRSTSLGFPTAGRITPLAPSDADFEGLVVTDADLQPSDSPNTD